MKKKKPSTFWKRFIKVFVRAKSLVRKIMRAGYFWPMMQQDATDFVKKYDSCQRYGNV